MRSNMILMMVTLSFALESFAQTNLTAEEELIIKEAQEFRNV